MFSHLGKSDPALSEKEVPLAGGRLNTVVRVGNTVRRPTGPWTPTVHALLDHLEHKNFVYSPRSLGTDPQGREILSYIPGSTVGTALPWPSWVWHEDLLAEVGRITAEYHRAVSDFRPEGTITWRWGPAELGEAEIVCHHDIAPYNVVVTDGRLRGFIDWDLVGPGTVRSELAFIAWQWVPLHDPFVTSTFTPMQPDLARRVRILLDSYGLEDREHFIDDVVGRIALNRDVMLGKASEGDAAYHQLVEDGHIIGMNRAIDFLGEVGADLQSRLE